MGGCADLKSRHLGDGRCTDEQDGSALREVCWVGVFQAGPQPAGEDCRGAGIRLRCRAEGLLTAQIQRRGAGRAGRGSGDEGLARGGALGDAHPAAEGSRGAGLFAGHIRRRRTVTVDGVETGGRRGGALGGEKPAVHGVASGGRRGERR